MSLRNAIENGLDVATLNEYIESIPYAKFLGISAEQRGDNLLFILAENSDNVGNPTLPAIHGGVVGAFMEHAATCHLIAKMSKPQLPKIIDFSLDYLHPARLKDTFAECEITRQGRRIANVTIRAWQSNRLESIAEARAHFLLSE